MILIMFASDDHCRRSAKKGF